MLTEIGPENKKSRISASCFYGRPNCPCCGGWDKNGNRVKSRWTDSFLVAHHKPKSNKVRRWHGKKGKTLRDLRK